MEIMLIMLNQYLVLTTLTPRVKRKLLKKTWLMVWVIGKKSND